MPTTLAPASPAISAHRGGLETAPENSWEAFRSALDSSPEYVEFDVRRTRDGTWVVHHDESTRGHLVAELDYDQLCTIAGHLVPKAIDVMEFLAGRAIGQLDLKETRREREIVGAAIDIFGPGGFVTSTENAASIRRIKSFAPSVRTALVRTAFSATGAHWRDRSFDVSRILGCGADWVALDHRIATSRMLDRCRDHRLGIMLWTVNDDARIARYLADHRVEVLITDRPAYASRVREAILASRFGTRLVRSA